jgi:hypothetical protein
MAPLGFPPADVKYNPNDHRMSDCEDVIQRKMVTEYRQIKYQHLYRDSLRNVNCETE